jgi:hypothetical protein
MSVEHPGILRAAVRVGKKEREDSAVSTRVACLV